MRVFLRAGFPLSLASVLLLLCARALAQVPVPGLVEARRLLNARQFPAAEHQLRAVIAANPEQADARFLLGYTLFREREPLDSLAAYTDGARLRDPTPDDLVAVASDYILLKNYTDAARWLTRATGEAPANATAWYLLGRTDYNLDHAADAAAAFRRALALNPADTRAEYNLGLCEEMLGEPDKAIADYKQAIAWQQASGERDPQPFLDLGTLLLARQRTSEALSLLQAAATEGPDNALVQQQLGLALEAAGKLADAVAPLRCAIALAPKAEQPHYFLGRVYRKLGREKESAAEFATVARLAGTRSGARTPNRDQRP